KLLSTSTTGSTAVSGAFPQTTPSGRNRGDLLRVTRPGATTEGNTPRDDNLDRSAHFHSDFPVRSGPEIATDGRLRSRAPADAARPLASTGRRLPPLASPFVALPSYPFRADERSRAAIGRAKGAKRYCRRTRSLGPRIKIDWQGARGRPWAPPAPGHHDGGDYPVRSARFLGGDRLCPSEENHTALGARTRCVHPRAYHSSHVTHPYAR